MFNKKKKVKIQSVPGGEWKEPDGHALYAFINGKAGKKLMDNLRFTLYQEVMSQARFDEWKDARRAALALVIDAIEGLAEKPPE